MQSTLLSQIPTLSPRIPIQSLSTSIDCQPINYWLINYQLINHWLRG